MTKAISYDNAIPIIYITYYDRFNLLIDVFLKRKFLLKNKSKVFLFVNFCNICIIKVKKRMKRTSFLFGK